MSSMSDIAAILDQWEAGRESNPVAMRQAGDDLAALVRELAAREVPEPETYTPKGLPRRAAARARELGAKITFTFDGDIRADFPNGSMVVQRCSTSSKVKGRARWLRRLEWARGAAPGALPPPGNNIEAVLLSFIEQEEGRRRRA